MSRLGPQSSTEQGVPEIVEHLFRDEAGKMVAILTRIFGLDHLMLAEDVVQEALIKALQTWPYYGVPKNPSAWIMQVSRNLALDTVRREQNFRGKETQIVQLLEQRQSNADESIFLEQEIKDDRLRLMFACCHPAIPQEAQVALALKTLCGFSIREISCAFLTSEAAIAKRLTRAGQKIREAKIPFEIPAGDELSPRLDGLLQTIYLLFSEGYKASSGDNLIRENLCREAIRLASLLVEHPVGNKPLTHAVLALMYLNGARLPARIDGAGNILRLQEQDRSRWDQSMIARGMYHLAKSGEGDVITDYHLEAAIAAHHCAARNYESTEWSKILDLYDRLMKINNSSVVALNRAVAVANVKGADAGIAAIESIANRDELESYYLFHAVLGEFESRRKNFGRASECFRHARDLAPMKSEQRFLSERLLECQG